MPWLRALISIRRRVANRSMLRTLSPGDRVLVDRLAYRWRRPGRGDLVLFRHPPGGGMDGTEEIKRIVGRPGDRVELQGERIMIDGEPLAEPYLAQPSSGSERCKWQLGPDQYLLLADNRPEGTDGRHFGPLPRRALIGPLWYRYWPPERAGRL